MLSIIQIVTIIIRVWI